MRLEALRKLDVVDIFKENFLAGRLSRTARGARFTYDASFRQLALAQQSYGVAFSISPTAETHDVSGTNLHPFFAGLLPEGLRLKALRRILKTSEDDLFSMLLALGSNCIGDVYVKPQMESLSEEYEAAELAKVSFLEVFQKSIASSDPEIRERDSGVAGVIPKLSASMISFPLRISKRSKQYILKLGVDEHPHLIQNEHFFMEMASDCGFECAATTIVQDREDTPGVLIERFDRRYDKENRSFTRLHQEDACQFLNLYPQDKYRVSLREVAAGIELLSSSPLIDIRKLIELYLFSYLIGNGDLHAKNISLLEETPNGRIRLSPSYDLLSTLPYGDRKMALSLGAKDDNFRRPDLIKFGKLFTLPERALDASIKRLITRMPPWIKRVSEIGFNEKQTRDIQRTFEERAKKLV